jgi:hypothetical protein
LQRIPNGFGIPNPELLNPDIGTGFGIYKSHNLYVVVKNSTDYRMALEWVVVKNFSFSIVELCGGKKTCQIQHDWYLLR